MITIMKYLLLLLLTIFAVDCHSQHLQLKKRAANALSGSEFSKSIRDSSLSLEKREEIIFNEIRSGNIPTLLQKTSCNQGYSNDYGTITNDKVLCSA
jgi:hypothetical protein